MKQLLSWMGLLVLLPVGMKAASFEVLPASGDFAGMGQVGGISADGAVIAAAGWSIDTWSPQAMEWSATGGAVNLEASTTALGGGAGGVSDTGTVIAGWRFDPSGRASCWVNQSRRGLTGFRNSAANDVSGDGATAVGRNPTSENTSYYGVAAKWSVSSGNVTTLGDFAGGATHSEATRISNDGSTVVGWGTTATGVHAFRVVGSGSMTNLGELSGGVVFSEALDVSSNGSVVVGRSESANGMEAFVWNSVSGMSGLGDLPGGIFQSTATGVSSDGTIVTGTGYADSGNEVFVWDADKGMRSLFGLLDAAGVQASGYRFTYCRPVISADGDTLAGDAIAPDQSQVLWRVTGLRSLLSGVPLPPVQLNLTSEGFLLGFKAHAGFIYQVQCSPDLTPGSWDNVGDPILGDGSDHVETAPFDQPACFYRLVVENTP